MYKFFREKQKQLLAFFGVILMIAFVMPTTMKNAQSERALLQGKIGDEKVMREQVEQARAEWDFLAHTVRVRSEDGSFEHSILDAPRLMLMDLQPVMRDNPDAFALLQIEAQKMGLSPQYEEADEALKQPTVAIHLPDNRNVALDSLNDLNLKAQARQALADALMVSAAFRRAAQAVKISEPLVQLQLAQQFQSIKTRLVDFPAKEFEDKVPAPTDDQLKKQFEQYADILQETPASAADPFGFGYKYPNRVKLQYIGVPRDEVRKAVKAQQTQYQWDVDANRYYLQHQGEFISTTRPAPASMSLGPIVTPPASTTKPYPDVKEEIISRLVEPKLNNLQNQIQQELKTKMEQDYETWQKAHPNGPSTAPGAELAGTTTAPSTTPSAAELANAPYESFEYLQKLAADILKKYNVTLTVASATDSFKSAKQLSSLGGIGQIPQFGDYAVVAAEPFVPADQRQQPAVMSLYEPSRMLPNESRDGFFFRLTAADASHRPASVDEVREQVEQDWRRVQAFELAKTEAKKLLEAAQSEELEKVAGDRKVVQTGAYNMSEPVIENYPLTSRSQPEFVQQTFAMIDPLLAKKSERPTALIELPADAKVTVAELVFVDSKINSDTRELAKEIYTQQMLQQNAAGMASAWFNYDALVDRLGYVDSTKKPKAAGSPAPIEED